jgi:arylsulfatase A-like enzyme
MNFRLAYSTLAALLLVLCTPVEGKPNIVIIFADDVGTGDVPGYWDGGTRNGRVAMPNLEYLLGNGTTFTDAHSTPLCAPSRYVLLSGNYQHRGEKFGGSWTVNYEGNQFRKRQKSIARVLGDSGYKTAMFGKWHLGGKSCRNFVNFYLGSLQRPNILLFDHSLYLQPYYIFFK